MVDLVASAPARSGAAPRTPLMWLGLVAAALLSTALSWFTADRLAQVVRVEADEKASSDPYAFEQLNAELIRVNSRDAGARYAALGGVTGLVFAVLGLALGRKPVAGMIGVVTGVVIGAAVGWATVQKLYPSLYEMERDPAAVQIHLIILGHWAMWGGAGLAAGLGYAWGAGRFKALPWTILGGVFGVGSVGLLYELIIPMIFPTLPDVSHALPEEFIARLIIWIAVPLGAAIGIGAALSLGNGSPPKPPSLAMGSDPVSPNPSA
ncbi:hypothetical protein Isop_0127 [Isosphaera pallida ATCC 43644]|uniref:CbtA family protein n=1 Tax=Isosphaera pallida (strain ATCC 43644 / DSM 9630 / IS1B) TaxID=575540 RepID=E8R629_ISOPI|nr:hypothetical protein [Isosphaera pallida]ADV60724.1 hypothetical protein Isop_0127 [Isosphaera pallida ATCC 43644]